MSTVCIGANCLYGPRFGGMFWAYLNWALGALSNGCRVVWLEGVDPATPVDEAATLVDGLRARLADFGLGDSLALAPWGDSPLDPEVVARALDLDAATEADLLIDLVYDLPRAVVDRFGRSALVSVDPGLLEVWMRDGTIEVADHDLYFTIGARSLDDSREWRRTQPCVSLDRWTVSPAPTDAPFTTLTNWYGNEWIEHDGEVHRNDKRAGFLPFIDLPRLTSEPLELAVHLGDAVDDEAMLRERGWRLADPAAVAGSPNDYRRYVGSSKGEFGCAKPFYARLETGWFSDRSVCYLASGKPVVVQDTGPNDALADREGVFRFKTAEEAARCLDECAADYERHCKAARSLAEERFDARLVVGRVLEDAL